MSKVTNLLIHIGMFDEEQGKMSEVNAYFLERHGRPPVSIDDEKLPHGWYGGSKMLECKLYVGAFNHLYLDGFIAHLRSITTWQEPEVLQLIVQEDGDDMFRIIQIFPEREEKTQQ